MNKRLEVVEREITQLMTQMIIDMKLEKQLLDENVDQYIAQIEIYRSLTQDDKMLKKTFVSKMFYMFSTLVFNAQYINYEPNIMKKIFLLRECLIKLLDCDELYG